MNTPADGCCARGLVPMCDATTASYIDTMTQNVVR